VARSPAGTGGVSGKAVGGGARVAPGPQFFLQLIEIFDKKMISGPLWFVARILI
jgi:hypothetical protein